MFLNRKNKFLQKLRSEKSHPYKFLVIRNGLVGDTVFITPVINKLYRNYKNSTIDFAGSFISAQVLKHLPGLNNFFTLPKFGITSHVKFFFSLRKKKYDCILVQEMNTHYSLMAKLVGAKLIFGYNHKLKGLHDFTAPRKGHAVEAEQALINIITGSSDIEQTILFVSPEEEEEAKKILAESGASNKRLIVIQSSCSEQNSIRQLSEIKLALLADRLHDELNAEIIFTGTTSEARHVEKIQKLMKNKSISLAGKTTLRNLMAIIKQSTCVIGPDTGTLHVANAVGVPIIMYMGWAIPEDTGPFDLTCRSKVIKANLDCIPCKYREPKPANWEYCKVNRPTLCMDAIEVDELIASVKTILEKS